MWGDPEGESERLETCDEPAWNREWHILHAVDGKPTERVVRDVTGSTYVGHNVNGAPFYLHNLAFNLEIREVGTQRDHAALSFPC